MYTKIAGPLRVQSDGATTLTYELDALDGGSGCKVMVFSIRVLAKSSNVALGLQIRQSPEGTTYTSATGVLSLAAAPSAGASRQGATGTPDTDASDVLNEFVRPQVQCGVTSGTSDQWAVIEVFALKKRPSRAGPTARRSPMQQRREARGSVRGSGDCGCRGTG